MPVLLVKPPMIATAKIANPRMTAVRKPNKYMAHPVRYQGVGGPPGGPGGCCP